MTHSRTCGRGGFIVMDLISRSPSTGPQVARTQPKGDATARRETPVCRPSGPLLGSMPNLHLSGITSGYAVIRPEFRSISVQFFAASVRAKKNSGILKSCANAAVSIVSEFAESAMGRI